MNKSQTLYKESFYKLIKNIIGEHKVFIKNNKNKRNQIFTKLKELSILSEFTNSFKSDFNYENKELEKEKNFFIELYNTSISQVSPRKDSGELGNQIRLVIGFIIKYAFDNGFIENKINIDDVLKQLKPEFMFYIILSTSVSCIKHIDIDDVSDININEIERNLFTHKLINNLIIHIIIKVIEDKSRMVGIVSTLLQNIPAIIYGSSNNNLNQCYFKCCHQLIILFIEALSLETRKIDYKNEKNQPRSLVLIKLTDKILENNISPTYIPQIIEPENDYETIEDHINLYKRIKNGISTVNLSSKTKEALQVSMRKKFVINKNCIELFKFLDNLDYEIIKDIDCLPFTPMKHLIFLENKILELKNNIGEKVLSDIKNFYIERRKMNEYTHDIDEIISKELGISVEISQKARELYNLKKNYKSRIKLRILHNTIMKFAEIFEGFPIYFINSIDYRLRMYPWNYMFNRTSGIYKYLMMESKSKIKRKEINLMIENFFKNNLEYTKKFNEIKNDMDDNQIIKWFKEMNVKPDFNSDSFFYYYLLGKEIEDLIDNNFKTGFLLEIDQKASSSVLLSIILGDNILAQQTNLISKSEIKDANSYIMKKSVEWFKGKISEESYKIVCEERKLHKYLFMCSIYNQTMYGRMKRVKEYIKNGSDMITISTQYPEFINSVFPSISDKKSKFNKIVSYFLVNSEKPIEIETLDGSVITWHIFDKPLKINNKIKVKNPVTKLYEGLHLNLLDPRGTNKKKTIAGMLPSLIHSVDGSIMRLLILNVYEKDGYIINHLHDSVQFHPSKYDQILESITEVYTSKKFEDLLMKRFLEKLRKNLLEEKVDEFDKLVKDLYDEKFIKININKEDFNVKAMFPFE